MIGAVEFWNTYQPENATPEGRVVKTFQEAAGTPVNRVWTLLELDGPRGNQIARPGFVRGDSIGFVTTKKEWTDASVDATFAWGPDSGEQP